MKLKRKLIRNNRQRPTGTSASFVSTRLRPTAFASSSTMQELVRASTMFQHTNSHSTLNYSSVSVMLLVWHCGHFFFYDGYEKENGNYSGLGYRICHILYFLRYWTKWCWYWFHKNRRIYGSFKQQDWFGFGCRNILRYITAECGNNTHVKCWRYLLVDTGIQRIAERAGKVKRYLPSAWWQYLDACASFEWWQHIL